MEELKTTVKRDLSIFSVQAWQKGYLFFLKKSLKFRYPIIFHYDGSRVNFYHKIADFNYFKEVVTQKLIQDDHLFEKLNNKFIKNINNLKKLSEKITDKNITKIFELIAEIMSFYIFVVSDKFVSAKPAAWDSRHISEGILYQVDQKIELFLATKLSDIGLNKRYAHFLTKTEIDKLLLKKDIKIKKIAKRESGYILVNNRIYTELTLKQYCKLNKLITPNLEIEHTNSLNGSIACKGKVCGHAKIIHTSQDLKKIKKGDILISVMTNVTYLTVSKKASAIVTDEGGITCHAAIMARELQKPCITGTKFATKIFKDGDLIEVDANAGIVRKLNVN